MCAVDQAGEQVGASIIRFRAVALGEERPLAADGGDFLQHIQRKHGPVFTKRNVIEVDSFVGRPVFAAAVQHRAPVLRPVGNDAAHIPARDPARFVAAVGKGPSGFIQPARNQGDAHGSLNVCGEDLLKALKVAAPDRAFDRWWVAGSALDMTAVRQQPGALFGRNQVALFVSGCAKGWPAEGLALGLAKLHRLSRLARCFLRIHLVDNGHDLRVHLADRCAGVDGVGGGSEHQRHAVFIQAVQQFADPVAPAVEAAQVQGHKRNDIRVVETLFQCQPARPVLDVAAGLVPVDVLIPFGGPTVFLDNACDVLTLAGGACQVCPTAGERLANVAQGGIAGDLLFSVFGRHEKDSFVLRCER